MEMKPDIDVVLFDLGKTLMYSKHSWSGVFVRAYSALCNVLSNANPSSIINISPDDFQTCINKYYDQRNIDLIETGAFTILKEFLISKGYLNIADEILRQALDAMYAITQTNWFLEDETISTLSTLKNKGYRLGLISNASDDKDVQQMIDRWGLRPLFEFILTSAACGWRKPHPLMFRTALNHFSVLPHQTAMVGDTLTADISGAENLGIYSIWITRRVQLPDEDELPVQPQAIIPNLAELASLLDDIRSNP
jgi:putative hydrolase of the HAD superfamily